MKTQNTPSLLRRLAASAFDYWQTAAALGSWMYRSPYAWEFELINQRFPRERSARNSIRPMVADVRDARPLPDSFCLDACGCCAG